MSVVKPLKAFAIYTSIYKVCSVSKSVFSPQHQIILRKCSIPYKTSGRNSDIKQISTTSYLSSKVKPNEDELILHITEDCAKQLKKVAGPGEFLRLTVEGGGCSGFSYKFDLDNVVNEDDLSFEKDGMKVVSDKLSLELIKGSTVDYEVELIKSAFIVKDNPQSSTKCSCGISFAID